MPHLDPDLHHMSRALELAQRGEGMVEPNPMVGCVILNAQGDIVGEGWHQEFGGPHAEVNALLEAGTQAAGGTAYVTLEPCSHTGKTPPCADALIKAKLARVVVGCGDPFEQVQGRGIAKLRAARIAIQVGVLEDQAKEIIRPFAKRVTTGMPYVTAKWAQTLDGAIATHSGSSKWISSGSSRKWVHELRARIDAIIVGIGTALTDDPQLTPRDVPIKRNLRRVVIDPNLRLPNDAKLFNDLPQFPLTIAYHHKHASRIPRLIGQLEARGVECIALPDLGGSGELDLAPLLAHLSSTHLATNVMVEGGSRVHHSFLSQGLVDEVIAFVAPKLLADGHGRPPMRPSSNSAKVQSMSDAMPLDLVSMTQIEQDVMLRYRIRSRKDHGNARD